MNRTEAIKKAAKILWEAGVKGNITINDNKFAVGVMKENGLDPDPTPTESMASYAVINTGSRVVWVSRTYKQGGNK